MPSIIRATTTSGLQVAPDNSGSLQLQTNGTTTALTIDTSQNATFAGKVTSAGALTLASNGTTTAVTIDTSQNIGVGTTSPSPKITVARTATTSVTNASYYLGLGGTENLLDSKRLIGMGYSSGSSEEYPTAMGYVETSNAGYTNGAIAFYTRSVTTNTAPSERMRIDSSGRLLVGTTSSGGLGGLTTIPNYDGDTAGLIWNKSNATSTGAAEFRYNGTQKGYIAYTSTGTTYNTTSDYRLKENIEPMVNALEKVALLNPVTYTWIESGENGQGFIAHELQNVVPECVFGEKDAVNEDGSIKPQGIDTSFLVATLTAAIQELAKASSEQQTIINDLKARIETLEGAKLG